MYLLGYDLGTSSIKVALVSAETGNIIASTQSPETEMAIQSPQPDWAEQDPDLWWKHVVLATRTIIRQIPDAATQIEAIGFSYQMHGLVMVDAAGNVIRPSIIWCDSRAVEIGRRAAATLPAEETFSSLLNMPGNFTASKLKWVKEAEPEAYQRAHKIMLPGDYIAYRMTGTMGTTASGLSEAILWDFQAERPSSSLLQYYGLAADLIPEILPTFGLQGTISKSAAQQLGLSEGIPVTYRAGDQPNNALCLNVLQPGEVAATGGTSGVVYGVTDQLKGDPLQRVNSFAHVTHTRDAPRVGVLLCINGAGSMYAWLRAQIASAGISYPEMEKMAKTVSIGSDGVVVLPFGNGAERLLRHEPVGAHIMGINFARHTKAHLFRAGLEGIAFAFAYGMEVMSELGIDLSAFRVGNDNLFQSEIFSTTLSTLTNTEIKVLNTTGAVGAAIAAGTHTRGEAFRNDALSDAKPVKIFRPEIAAKPESLKQYTHWKKMLAGIRNIQ